MDELDRLFRRLVHNIRLGYPNLLTKPFELQQIYQTVVPYRHHRKELEIDSNDEYELAVMRLLSGERDYLLGEPQMQDALRQELMSANPDTSLYRMWATSQVTLNPEALRALDASPSGSMPGLRSTAATPGLRPVAPSPSAARAGVGTPSGPPVAPTIPRPSGVAPAAASTSTASAAPSAPPAAPRASAPATPRPARVVTPNTSGSGPKVPNADACRYCAGALPPGRPIVYCPHCGQNLTIVHCPACGTELELGWKFCVACGRSVV